MTSFNLLIIILSTLFYSSIKCQSPESQLFVLNNNETEWDVIKEGWPVEDRADILVDKRSQFFYIKDKNNTNEQHWSINQPFVAALKNKTKTYKMSFKYWIHTLYRNIFKPNVQYMHLFSHDIFAEYFDGNYAGHWMSQQISLTQEELESFIMTINPVNALNVIALKDFTLEYETKLENRSDSIQPPNDQTQTGSQLKDWSKYLNPSEYDSRMDPNGEFMYFSNECLSPCQLSSVNIPDHNDSNAELSFWYWVDNSSHPITRIEVNGTSDGLIADRKWHLYEAKDIKSPKNILIRVTTASVDVSQHAFVAIKDLKVLVHYKEGNSNRSQPYMCRKDDCLWVLNVTGNLLWTNHMPLYSDHIFFYPRNENNSLEYTYIHDSTDNTLGHNLDINEIDLCFQLEYFTAKEKEVTIDVKYNIKGDNYKDTIVSIRPKVGQMDSSFMCVRDLIALNAKDFVLSLSVRQHGYQDGVNGFALRPVINTRANLLRPTEGAHWNFEAEMLTFLSQWNANNFPEWKDEWLSLNHDITDHFKLSNISAKFTATTNSHTPASVHLISKWIQYDPKLHIVDPRFTIQTQSYEMFHRFAIKPKVCDWLMHCVDAAVEDINNSTSTLRTYTFKFQSMEHSKYIKLLFYIEYFQPHYYSSNDELNVEFDLRLTHFGDPCLPATFDAKCKNISPNVGVCHSNKRDLKAHPNDPICECDSTFNADCTPNYCNRRVPGQNYSMGFHCEESSLECENTANGDSAKCVCINTPNIIWNEVTHACVLPSPAKLDKWAPVSSLPDHYYPTGIDNRLNIAFTKIDTKRFDGCLNVNYWSTKVVSLSVDYTNLTSNTRHLLFTVSLHVSPSGTDFRLCMRDFIYNIDEDFTVSFIINHPLVVEWTESTFSLSYTPLIGVKSDPINYLRNWNHSIDNSYKSWIDWVSFIPNNSFERSAASDSKYQLKLKAPISGQIVSTAMLTSEWIIYYPQITQQRNIISFNFTENSRTYFKIRIKILNKNGVSVITTEPTFADSEIKFDGGIIMAIKSALPITNFTMSPGDPFKIIIEIIYAEPDNAPEPRLTQLALDFNDISVGDPCYDYVSHQFSCKNNAICRGFGPTNYTCDCSNEEFSGKNCDQPNYCRNENLTLCNKFPAIPIDMQKYETNRLTCVSNIPLRKYQCVCAGDYVWHTTFERCVRKRYEKTTLTCIGPLTNSMDSCMFMSSTRPEFGWSNTNLPVIYSANDKRLPLYYPKKVNATLRIEVKNLNINTDGCFKFHYYITTGANLQLKFNNNLIIDIRPTLVYSTGVNRERIEWLPNIDEDGETICLRKYFFHNTPHDNYNIIFIANISNLSNNMIALKFSNFSSVNDDTKSYVGFINRPLIPMNELPYLIHWSKIYGTHQDNDSVVNSNNFTHINQWPLSFPSKSWTFNNNTDTVTFKGTLTSVMNVAYLMSNWLQKDIEGYKLRFKIKSASNFFRYAIQTRVYDNAMNVRFSFDNQRIGDSVILNNANLVNQSLALKYQIPKVNTSFRVEFTVYYQLRQNDRHSDIEFTLESIDLGDPCVNDDTTFQGCSDHGHCTRHGPVDQYSCNCAAGHDANPLNCNTTDWCNYNHNVDGFGPTTGTDFCTQYNAGVCVNLIQPISGLNFKCNCSATTQWDAANKRCERIPRCPLSNNCNLHTEECKEPVGEDQEPTCDCINGYRKDNQTSSCEPYDPCNTRHNPEPCGKSKAQCFRTGLNASDTGYVCWCPRGYRTDNVHENTRCVSVMCDFHGLNNCQQKCTNNDTVGFTCGCFEDTYVVSGAALNECTRKEDKQCNCQQNGYYCDTSDPNKCVCQPGYAFNSTANTCELINTGTVDKFICPDGKVITDNGVLKCECKEGIYDRNDVDHHCDLKPICGAGSPGRANCESKNAKCVSDDTAIGNYYCECPEGKVFENGLSTKHEKHDPFKCIDYCAVNKREEICEIINARCVATKVYNQSAEQLLEFHDLYHFCECKPGFVRVNSSGGFDCILAQFTYELKLSIKDTFRYNNVSIANERLVLIIREASLRRKRQTTVAFDSLNDANRHAYYSDRNSSYHLNTQLDSESMLNLNKADFANLLSTRLLGILNDANLGHKINSVTVESCKLSDEKYYDCVFSVTLDGALDNKDDIKTHLTDVCVKQADSTDCYIRHVTNSDSLVFKSTSFNVAIYDPCDASRSAVNCRDYTECKRVNFPNTSYYSCACDPEYFDVKSYRTIINKDNTIDTFIDSCKPKDLCAVHCKAVMTDGGRCEQEMPKFANNKWTIAHPRCICGSNTKVLSADGMNCLEPCSSSLCMNHGTCQLSNQSPYYVCSCRDGWSGDHCDHEPESKSNSGWIAAVSVLAVLLLLAVGLALGFAYKFKQSSNRTKHSSGFMNKRLSLEDLQSSQTAGHQQSTMYSQQQSYH